MHLIDVFKKFQTKESCLDYLVALRWPNGVTCSKCGVIGNEQFHKFTTNETTRKRFSKRNNCVVEVKVPSRNLFECKGCGYQFSATAGTIFHDSHLPLEKWFQAVAMLLEAKKGMSALQVCRHLGLETPKGKKIPNGYKSIWYLCHRIREAAKENPALLSGTVEVDEAYIGGRYDPRRKKADKYNHFAKTPVVGLIERQGKLHAQKIPAATKHVLIGVVNERVAPGSRVITDELRSYSDLRHTHRHDVINHIREEYVRGDVHTNTIENFWSLLKRGIIGSYHQVSVKHLDRYLAEFTYRFNRRDSQPELFQQTVKKLLDGKPLQYKTLTASEISEP